MKKYLIIVAALLALVLLGDSLYYRLGVYIPTFSDEPINIVSKVENGQMIIPNAWNVSCWGYQTQLSSAGTYRIYFKGTNNGEGMVYFGFEADPHNAGGVCLLDYSGVDLLDGTDRYIDIEKKVEGDGILWLVNGNVISTTWDYIQIVKIA